MPKAKASVKSKKKPSKKAGKKSVKQVIKNAKAIAESIKHKPLGTIPVQEPGKLHSFKKGVEAVGEAKAPENTFFTRGANDFAKKFFGLLPTNENAFCSTYNIRTALAMTYAGARGETMKEMAQAIDVSPENPMVQHIDIADEANSLSVSKSATIKIANAIWIAQGQETELNYRAIVERVYKAVLKIADFESKGAEVVKEINEWVSSKTEKRIENLLDRVSPETRLVIASAIYFKADWRDAFKVEQTYDETFKTPGVDGGVPIKMMYRRGMYRYFENEVWQIIQLPYKNNELSMVICLPKKGIDSTTIRGFPVTIDETCGHRITEAFVHLPKFRMEHSIQADEVFKKAGLMTLAFSDEADFTGMIPKGGVKITQIVHKAFVEVSEEGTEAAAATAVSVGRAMSLNSEPAPVIFKADRPFLFAIRDNLFGNVLFSGRLWKP